MVSGFGGERPKRRGVMGEANLSPQVPPKLGTNSLKSKMDKNSPKNAMDNLAWQDFVHVDQS